MSSLRIALAASAVLAAALITACFSAPEEDEEYGSGEAHIEEADPLEGAYEKKGGTPLHFVFKRGDNTNEGTFLGEIEDNGKGVHANGKIKLGRDENGTTFTLTPSASTKKAGSTTASTDTETTGPDGGAPTDNRALVQQAFSGTMHYLKIGKNETILVRGDTNGKTAHYKKIKSWCSSADDCDPEVQKTGLDCADLSCTSKSTCACK